MRHILLLAAITTAALACSDTTSGPGHGLVGQWQTVRQNVSLTSSNVSSLSFGADGGFTSEVRGYGGYIGLRPHDLAFYYRVTGRYEVDGDSLRLHPQRSASWDRFYGADSPETVRDATDEQVYPYAHYSVSGFRMTLSYITYPADGPVPTQQEFFRLY